MLDKIWHLTPSVGHRCHLAGKHRAPLVSLSLSASLFSSLSAAISDFPSLEGTLAMWEVAA